MEDLENRRILIVDDNVSLHEDFRKILIGNQRQIGTQIQKMEEELFGKSATTGKGVDFNIRFSLDFAFQGEEALKMAVEAEKSGKPYALIFMDVRMPPGWDGV